MYKIFKSFLFLLDAEKAHNLMVFTLSKFPFVGKMFNQSYPVQYPLYAKGLKFKNRVGLAAGLDKDAKMINALDHMGFGFVEVGTVTPKAQPGNPKPRLFRLKKQEAIINRMGFNNEGVEAMKERLLYHKGNELLLGVNIGKNKDTPNENALDDYLYCLKELYNYGDYFTINISSPNTPGLRELHTKAYLGNLLGSLKSFQQSKHIKKPLFLKIAPDLDHDSLMTILDTAIECEIEGIIMTNTTIERESLKSYTTKEIKRFGDGGLSGKPLKEQANNILAQAKERIGDQMLIIAAGGITTGQDAVQKLELGADLVQIYSGFIYKGPALIGDCIKEIEEYFLTNPNKK